MVLELVKGFLEGALCEGVGFLLELGCEVWDCRFVLEGGEGMCGDSPDMWIGVVDEGDQVRSGFGEVEFTTGVDGGPSDVVVGVVECLDEVVYGKVGGLCEGAQGCLSDFAVVVVECGEQAG